MMDVAQKVALGAIKYPMISRENTKIVTFDWTAPWISTGNRHHTSNTRMCVPTASCEKLASCEERQHALTMPWNPVK